MTTEVVWVVGFVVAVVVAAVLVSRWVVRRRAAARSSLPPLFYPVLPQSPLPMPHVNGSANGTPHSNSTAHANGAPPARATPQASSVVPSPATPIPRVVDDRSRPQPQPQRTVGSFGDEYRAGETVRFSRPSEQAVQLLPGHLEVLEGADRDREIRFVRVPGKPLQVMLGRDAGRLPNTVGLGSATVSRRHARMDYTEGRWHVTNLSQTNPLVVNDDEVTDADGSRPLVDGDRLQLGEVVLRFHEH
jgi:pSer/pThr/pTyr-binding forkhead associated (FHA) protein